MASALTKRPCVQCAKGGAVITCDGCQQSFCMKHIIEHRQELALQLDTIGQEHDLFRRDLLQENLVVPLLARIDEWEQESINKIKVAADVVRADLRQLVDRTTGQLKTSVDKVTNEMQLCRESDDYTEIDLQRWQQELRELRKLLETKMIIEIENNDNESTAIRMIKLREHNPPPCSSLATIEQSTENLMVPFHAIFEPHHERFCNVLGKIVLSEDGLIALCSGIYWDGSSVFGSQLYLSGMHEIRFRIENKGTNNIFFGIKTAMHDMPVQTLTSSSVYGWWELDQAIESISGYRMHQDRIIRTGDEVTMTLDCDNRMIRLEHHRVNRIIQLPVELERCPFPWQIVITLLSVGDSIRILL